jgi:hypothetical protein
MFAHGKMAIMNEFIEYVMENKLGLSYVKLMLKLG